MSTETHVPTEHSSVVGGSNAGRRIACPASLALEKLVPEDKVGSAAAREGTVLHEIMTVLLQNPEVDVYGILPFKFTHKDGWTHTVDEDVWDKLGQPALDAFLDYMDRMEAATGAEFEYKIEIKCEMPGVAGAYGTVDVLWRCGHYAGIWDWKFGFWGVPAAANPQLMFYARAAMATMPAFFEGVEVIELAIMQPARNEEPDTWETDGRELEDFRIELVAALDEATKMGNMARMKKGGHCKYARCTAVCPLHLNPTLALAQKLGLRKDQNAELIAQDKRPLADDEALDNQLSFVEMLPDLLELASVAEKYAEEVFARAHTLAETDDKTRDALREAGWVLKDKRPGARQWQLTSAEIMKGAKSRGLNLDIVAPRKLATPKKIEDALTAKGKKMPDDWAKVPPSSGTTLVRQTGDVKEVQTAGDVARRLGARLAQLR